MTHLTIRGVVGFLLLSTLTVVVGLAIYTRLSARVPALKKVAGL